MGAGWQQLHWEGTRGREVGGSLCEGGGGVCAKGRGREKRKGERHEGRRGVAGIGGVGGEGGWELKQEG